MQAHFSRITLPTALESDQKPVAKKAILLAQAMVDVVSSHGWLRTALTVMEFTQMLHRAMWDCMNLGAMGMENVFDLIDALKENSDRLVEFLDMELVRRQVHKFPALQASWKKLEDAVEVTVVNESITIQPEPMWLVIGNEQTDTLLTIKRIVLPSGSQSITAILSSSEEGGKAEGESSERKNKLFVVLESWIGADLEYDLSNL